MKVASRYCILICLALALSETCIAQARQRQRVSYAGTLVGDTYGLAEGETSPSRGDTIYLKVRVNQGELIYVQAHQYVRNSQIGEPPLGDEQILKDYRPSPPAEDRFKSSDTSAATANTTFRGIASADQTVGVFFPFHASRHPPGRYGVTYRIRVWVNEQLRDDYFVSAQYWAHVERSKVAAYYRLAPPGGPDVLPFNLVNSDSPSE